MPSASRSSPRPGAVAAADVPTLHDIIPSALARLASAAPEPTAERRTAARANRASAGRRRLDNKLLTGALAGALVTMASYPSILGFGLGEEEILANPGEYRFPPGTETRGALGGGNPDAWCGQALPEPLAAGGGFTLTATATTDAGGTPKWFSALTYEGPDRDAYVDDSVGLIARDGIVVGVQYNVQGSTYEPLHFRDGGNTSAGFSAGGYAGVSWCSLDWTDPQPEDLVVRAGDYEAVWVMRAHMTARDQALKVLREAGYSLAASTPNYYPDDVPQNQRPTSTWSPGSVDCIRAALTATFGWEPPLQCERTLPDFVRIEPDTGAYLVSFDPSQVEPPLDVTLVSEPVSFSLGYDLTRADLGYTGPYEEPTPEPPSCGSPGEPYQWLATSAQGIDPASSMSNVLSGTPTRLWLDFEPTMGDTDATVTLPEGERVWIAPGYGNLADERGLAFGAYATVHFSAPVVKLHRANGYPDVDVWLTDVTLCEGSAPGDPFLTSDDTWLYIPSSVEVVWESGRVEVASDMAIRQDSLRW